MDRRYHLLTVYNRFAGHKIGVIKRPGTPVVDPDCPVTQRLVSDLKMGGYYPRFLTPSHAPFDDLREGRVDVNVDKDSNGAWRITTFKLS